MVRETDTFFFIGTGLPAILSGRDVIGIAFTGSGKSLAFVLPMIMASMMEEKRMPLEGGEGPVGLILCPSRELARQTHEVIEGFTVEFHKQGMAEMRIMLCIGGIDGRAGMDTVRDKGMHMVTATPGRLKDHLHRKRMNLDICKFLVMDEADRMVDLGFEEDIRGTAAWAFQNQAARRLPALFECATRDVCSIASTRDACSTVLYGRNIHCSARLFGPQFPLYTRD
tara:strand:- start:928 stop:1605 length:678 start_codon:yes stop_codon:yes gene_type:complete